MKTLPLRLFAAVAAVITLGTYQLNAQLVENEEVLPAGSEWSHLLYAPDTGGGIFTPLDPSSVDPDFYSTWQLGGASYNGPEFKDDIAPLGYGAVTGDPLVTNIWAFRDGNDAPPTGSRYTAYFRTTISPTEDTIGLRFSGILDDGAVVYVDGVEVYRTPNMPAGADVWDLLTTATGSENTAISFDVTGLSITGGSDATIAVSVHSAAPDSSDMGMNFRVVTLEAPPASAPPNDDFFDAEILTGTLPITVIGRTHDNLNGPAGPHGVGATFEADEPLHAGDNGVGSIWYGYLAENDGRLAVSAGASNFDAIIAVYTGGDLDELVEVASSASDDVFYPRATVLFEAIAGVQYWIVVDGPDNGGSRVEGVNFGDVSLTVRGVPEPLFTEIAELLPAGSNWRYLLAAEDDPVDPLLTNQPVDPALFGAGDPDFHTTWHTAAAYNGPAFAGPAPALLGYGAIAADPIITDIWGARDTDNNPLTENLAPPSGLRYATYFRTTFTPPSAVAHLGFRGLIDDGAAIYINGELVSSINFTGNPEDWQAFALGVADTEVGPQEGIALNVNLPAGVPVEIGVTVRSNTATSSDIGFDLAVYSIEQPPLDFGQDFAVAGPFRASFEDATAGDSSGLGDGGEDDNLPWVASAGTVEDEAGLPNPGSGQAVYVNGGAIEIISGRVDLANVDNSTVFAALDVRAFEDSDGSDFEAVDSIEAFIEGSTDGFSFTRVATILPARTGGTPDRLKTLELPGGEYTTFNSTPGVIPSDIRTIRIVVSALNNSLSEHFFIDNLSIDTGLPPTAPFIATITRNFINGQNRLDWEGDGSSLYQVRYSHDLKNWTEIGSGVGIDTFTHTPPAGDVQGYYEVQRLDD